MDFLKLTGKKIVVFGLANRKSVACATAKVLNAFAGDFNWVGVNDLLTFQSPKVVVVVDNCFCRHAGCLVAAIPLRIILRAPCANARPSS